MNRINKYSLIIAMIATLFGLFMIIISSNFLGKITPNEIKETQGLFVKYYESPVPGGVNGHSPTRYICTNDGKEYEINSVEDISFKKEKFFNEVKINDVLKISYYETSNTYSLLSIDSGGKNYMDLLTSQNARHVNQKIGIVLGLSFILMSFIGLISDFLGGNILLRLFRKFFGQKFGHTYKVIYIYKDKEETLRMVPTG